MATIHIMHGFVAFGKTTLSKKLAAELPAVRLCTDEWIVKLYGEDDPEFKKHAGLVTDLQWGIAKQVINTGVDVVMDMGPWDRYTRKKMADAALAITPNLIFHSIILDMATARERLIKRNANNPENYVGLDFFDDGIRRFEPMSDDEGYVIKRYFQE